MQAGQRTRNAIAMWHPVWHGERTKRRLVKIGIALAAGLVIVLALAIMVVAWVRGGVQPAQMVEIPVQIATPQAGGA